MLLVRGPQFENTGRTTAQPIWRSLQVAYEPLLFLLASVKYLKSILTILIIHTCFSHFHRLFFFLRSISFYALS